VLDGMEIPKGNEQFLGVVCPPKTLCVTFLVYAAKKINNGTNATAASDCFAADWSVSC